MAQKLIEVALPLEEISAACKKDKDRKTGTIRNIHKWFAPMPTPAWRAILFASLVDAPSDPQQRKSLLDLIRALVESESQPPSQAVLAAATQAIRDSVGDQPPMVVDPFCGGGSTVVEAQRLGLPAFASDLNPLAVLITRALTEIPPRVFNRLPVAADSSTTMRLATGLSGFLSDLETYGKRIYERAQSILASYYPISDQGQLPIGWLWARTVKCPNPACGTWMPLITSFWLSRRRDEHAWLSPRVTGDRIAFDVINGAGTPPSVPKLGRGAKFRCLACGETAPEDFLKTEGKARRMGLQLVATIVQGAGRRIFLPASPEQERAGLEVKMPNEAPTEKLPIEPRSIWCTQYGIERQADLYTPRQLVSMTTFATLLREVATWIIDAGGDRQYAVDVTSVLALALGRLAQSNSSLVRWRIDSRSGVGQPEKAFGRHDIPLLWDFVEVNPIGGGAGDWLQALETGVRAFNLVDPSGPPVTVAQRDARHVAEFIPANSLIATDPPYFDNIGYADLSDYFYVWLRRALRDVDPDLTSTLLTPKKDELIASPSRHAGSKQAAKDFFIQGFTETFTSLAERLGSDLPLVIVYAFRQQESQRGGAASTGWEAMLEALLGSGLAVGGTWPIHGTGTTRQIGLGQNALASYIVLVCRRRLSSASIATRKEFLSALRVQLPGAVGRLKEANVAPVDLAQAAIGPGMAVFSRFSKVVEADGSSMSVRTALMIINDVLDETLSEQESEFDPDTRWALAWFESHGTSDGPYGEAEVLSKAKDTSVTALAQDGFLLAKAGRVRLLGWKELDSTWDPSTDSRLSVWEVTHHLIRTHQDPETGGEQVAAALLRKVGHAYGNISRDLAYRLYTISERKGWVAEALAYNALIVAWPEIVRLAATNRLDQEALEV